MIKLAVHIADLEAVLLTCSCGWLLELLELAGPVAINKNAKTMSTEVWRHIYYGSLCLALQSP